MNETILEFTKVTEITQSFPFTLALLVVWLFPLFLFLLYGIFYTKKSGGKSVSGTRPITKMGFWIAFLIFFFVQGSLFLFGIYYPLWTKIL